jgi:hypothetical protein
MAVEKYNDSLPSSDILEPVKVFFVHNQCSLNIRDGPVVGNVPGIRVHNTYRLYVDAHIEVRFQLGASWRFFAPSM